ncbi:MULTISPECIES: hypothetical protein [Chryseobacterium]|nr:hypothetical protein [Chryseobacterium piscicola]
MVKEGNATDNGAEWVYISTASNPDLSGDKNTVIALDNPANMSEKTQTL